MALYTFMVSRGSQGSERTGGYADDTTAINVARAFLTRVATGTTDRPLSISVGRRTTKSVERLGVWDFDLAMHWAPAG